MAKLMDAKGLTLVKGLACGVSGGGKTGALACLAKAGYRIFIFDFDNGFQILQDPSILPVEARDRVFIRHFEDKAYTTATGMMWASPVTAAPLFMRELEKNEDMGALKDLGPNDIIVIDSLTFLGNAYFRLVLQMAGRLNQPKWRNDWGLAMEMEENLLALLYSNLVPCNVIVNCHLTWIGGDDNSPEALGVIADLLKKQAEAGQAQSPELAKALTDLTPTITPVRAYPSALGKVLPPKVGRYFNTMVKVKTMGSGASERRVISTRSEPDMELKVPCPGKIPAILPINEGWLTIFKAIRGE